MFVLRLKLAARERLLFCSCLLALSGRTPGHGNGLAAIEVAVKEMSDAILPCSLSTTVELKLFDWRRDGQKGGPKEVFMYDAGIHYNNGRPGQDEQFKGRVSHFPDELKNGNASIIIRNTTVTDSGNYTCDFPRLQPERKIFHIKLVVELPFKDRLGEIPGAAPEPYIKTLNQTKDWALLQCDVRGASPKPKVEWWDSAGNILHAKEPQISERGGSYNITLLTTVTKTDHFSCVLKQADIKHVIAAQTFVYIHEEVCEDSFSKVVTGWFGGFLLGALTLAAVLALLVAAKCITIGHNKGSREQRNGSCSGDAT